MTRTHVLAMLLQHGALLHDEVREITGWSAKRLARGVELATRPRGPVRRKRHAGRWLYRLATDEERSVPMKPRGVKPGSCWSEARRVAARSLQ